MPSICNSSPSTVNLLRAQEISPGRGGFSKLGSMFCDGGSGSLPGNSSPSFGLLSDLFPYFFPEVFAYPNYTKVSKLTDSEWKSFESVEDMARILPILKE